MKRYIDVDKLKEIVDRQYKYCHGYNGAKKDVYKEAILAIKSVLHCQSVVDVAEVKHGKNITKMHPVDEFICSQCGLILRDLTEVRIDEENEDECYYEFEVKYCPCCGARIEGLADE